MNGKDVSDSQLAIEYLDKEPEKSFNDHLKPEVRSLFTCLFTFSADCLFVYFFQEAAVARAFQVTLDDRFAWCLAIDRLVYGQGKVSKDTNTA